MTDEESQERQEGISPIVLALVVCDGMYIDPGTGKKSLMGMFSVVNAVKFPAVLPAICLYVAMTNGHGKTPFTIRLVDHADERPPVFEGKAEFDFRDPRLVLEVATLAGNIVFPEPGAYALQVVTFGAPLLERRIIVRDATEDLPDEAD